jgi:sugar phosphate isomerase/epimerase
VTVPTISLQLYTLRDAVAVDLQNTLQRVADLGFQSVEPYGFGDRIDDFARAFAATGLDAPSGHAPLLALDDPRSVFEGARQLGMTMVIDPYTSPERWASRDEVLEIADGLNRLAEIAAEVGVEVGYHNHFWEFESEIDGGPAFDVLLGALDPRVFLEIDTYWAAVGGQSPAELLSRLGDRVRLIHVKDGPITLDTEMQVAAGEGAMDIPAVLAAAPNAIRVVELDAYSGDVFDAVERSLQYLETLT